MSPNVTDSIVTLTKPSDPTSPSALMQLRPRKTPQTVAKTLPRSTRPKKPVTTTTQKADASQQNDRQTAMVRQEHFNSLNSKTVRNLFSQYLIKFFEFIRTIIHFLYSLQIKLTLAQMLMHLHLLKAQVTRSQRIM